MVNQFWKSFLEVTKKDASTTYYESFRFEVGEELSTQLLQLVLSGKKKATASSLLAYEVSGEEIPKVGDYSIITDWNHVPQCVIETTNVVILPFNEITWEMCRREGEDENLESW